MHAVQHGGVKQERATLLIDRCFRGPPRSGNGGYVCGRLAEFFAGDCRVRLLRPPPLDRELTVVPSDDGGLALFDGDRPIAQARPEALRMTASDLPPAVSPDEARHRSRAYRGFEDHAFGGCFVCGPDRETGDGLRIFPGAGPDGRVASPWRPDAALAGADGTVATRFVWAALDCPSGWAWLHAGGRVAVLGELAAHIDKPVPSETDLVVVGWRAEEPDDTSSRKHRTASALYTAGGTPLAWAEATWIDVDPASLAA